MLYLLYNDYKVKYEHREILLNKELKIGDFITYTYSGTEKLLGRILKKLPNDAYEVEVSTSIGKKREMTIFEAKASELK